MNSVKIRSRYCSNAVDMFMLDEILVSQVKSIDSWKSFNLIYNANRFVSRFIVTFEFPHRTGGFTLS